MLIYRVCHRRYAASLFNPRLSVIGSRWLPPYHPVLYACQSATQGALELLTLHRVCTPADFVYAAVKLPEPFSRTRIQRDRLPAGWTTAVHLNRTQQIGVDWYRARAHLVLAVPSSVLSGAWHFLIHPGHREYEQLQFGPVTRLASPEFERAAQIN